jgi:hypothetical protein
LKNIKMRVCLYIKRKRKRERERDKEMGGEIVNA